MAFRIKNTSHQLLVITLNSGKTVHIAPQDISESIEEIEKSGNPRLEKMKKNSLISIEEEKKKEVKVAEKAKGTSQK